jgi:hypothetical protein
MATQPAGGYIGRHQKTDKVAAAQRGLEGAASTFGQTDRIVGGGEEGKTAGGALTAAAGGAATGATLGAGNPYAIAAGAAVGLAGYMLT